MMKPSDHQSQEAAPLLKQHLSRKPRGKALDIACGYGRNALYLAAQGFQVEGFDRNESAVHFCNEKAESSNLSFTAKTCDLEKGQHFLENNYALATCFYYLDRNIIPQVKKALQIGGLMIYETFLIDQHKRYGKPSRTAFCWEHNELLSHFLDFRLLYYYEGPILSEGEKDLEKGTWVAQLIAERLL